MKSKLQKYELCDIKETSTGLVCIKCHQKIEGRYPRKCLANTEKDILAWLVCPYRGEVLSTINAQSAGCGCGGMQTEIHHCTYFKQPVLKQAATRCLEKIKEVAPTYTGITCQKCQVPLTTECQTKNQTEVPIENKVNDMAFTSVNVAGVVERTIERTPNLSTGKQEISNEPRLHAKVLRMGADVNHPHPDKSTQSVISTGNSASYQTARNIQTRNRRTPMGPVKADTQPLPSILATNPIPRPAITIRNLIYHVYADKKNEVWRKNVQQLTKRWNLFNGRRIIAVATCKEAHVLDTVKAEFSNSTDSLYSTEFIRFFNDANLREVATFLPMLDMIYSLSPVEATFYAHTKGNTNKKENTLGMARWRNAMYANLLDRPTDVKCELSLFSAVGTTVLEGGFNFPSKLKFGTGFWMFSGTFFWFRHDAIFSKPAWQNVPADRYGAEAWLGTFIPISEVQSMFQPWPPTEWPVASPYSPQYYAEIYSD